MKAIGENKLVARLREENPFRCPSPLGSGEHCNLPQLGLGAFMGKNPGNKQQHIFGHGHKNT